MSLKDAWREAFPIQPAQAVVEYVLTTWEELAARKVAAFSWSQREPDLTQTLKQCLEDKSREAGFTGYWGAEDASRKLDPVTLVKLKGFRTDIKYHSDRNPEKILSLTFEWKKLTSGTNSRKGYYGKDGMGRFLETDGYAKDVPFGIMVAIVESPAAQSHFNSLMKAMEQEDVAGLLQYVPDTGGKILRAPSIEMPKLAKFDTQHVRSSGGFETFTFSHLVVQFPS